MIKEYRPRYNISFRDDKRFLVVRVDLSEEWPRFRLARFKKDDGSRYFGPYAHAGALRQTLNFMRKRFGVLTFGRGAPTERELKSSTYQVPVRLSETSAEQYRERVAQACDFLEGKSREMISALEEQMHIAAEKMDFEKAAELRNMFFDARKSCLYCLAQPVDRSLLLSYFACLLFHLLMLLEKLVEQHRVHRIVAHSVRVMLFVAHDQLWICLGYFFSDQAKLRCPFGVGFEREDRFAGAVHRFDFGLEPA